MALYVCRHVWGGVKGGERCRKRERGKNEEIQSYR